jgi:hypothetical protein
LIIKLPNALTQLMQKRLTRHVPQHAIPMCLALGHQRVSPLVSLRRIVALSPTIVAQFMTMDFANVATAHLASPLFVLPRASITPPLMVEVRPRMPRIAWKQEPHGCRQQALTNRRLLWPPLTH